MGAAYHDANIDPARVTGRMLCRYKGGPYWLNGDERYAKQAMTSGYRMAEYAERRQRNAE